MAEVVLCPVMKHSDTLATLSYYAWAKRGWCSTEKVVGQLEGRGKIMLIESPKHVSLVGVHDVLYFSAADGEFTVEEDREYIVELLKNMLDRKLRSLLKRGDLHSYRFFLNQQHSLFRNCQTASVSGVLPPMQSSQDGDDGVLECFLYQNGFQHFLEEDEAGWSPLCYAVMAGQSALVETLIRKAADPNFTIKKSMRFGSLPPRTSALSLCVRFGEAETLKLLLQKKADPNRLDGLGANVLGAVAYTNNVQKVKLLLEAKADPCVKNRFNINPLQLACNAGATHVVRELLKTPALKASRYLLHYAVMFLRGGDPENISALLDAKCDVDEQYLPPTFGSKLYWSFFAATRSFGHFLYYSC